jgi:hypothetical protein
MDRDTATELLGKTGEKIVANHFAKQGSIVEHALNNFDRVKDLLIDGLTTEVKTEQPYVKKNAITIGVSQLKKCKSVQKLIFVTLPPLINPKYKWAGYIFNVDPKTFTHEEYETSFKKRMIAIPIEQEAVSVIRKLTNEEISELSKYAQSAYGKK